MKIYLYLLSFILCYYSSICVQPYFPEQIVFRVDSLGTLMAIDEINQRAFINLSSPYSDVTTAIGMINISYATPDSPQTKYYVELAGNDPSFHTCSYTTYWAYGVTQRSMFPSHWISGHNFQVKNYMQFQYQLIKSTNSSLSEDYWYANETCLTTFKGYVQCEEIFFQKNTDIPLRYTYIYDDAGYSYQGVRQFRVLSVGKPDDKYFNSIPKTWPSTCIDSDLKLVLSSTDIKILVNNSDTTDVSLSSPPHRIDGNDTTIIEWKIINECTDCVTWAPEQLSFNSQTFKTPQTLTITRVKKGFTRLIAIANGGGFNPESKDKYYLTIL